MSWQATAWAAKQKTGSPARKLLLLALANYADDQGECWPSQQTLADDTEQSVDTVQRHLKWIEANNLVRKIVMPQGRGRWAGRKYKLAMPVAKKTKPQNAVSPIAEVAPSPNRNLRPHHAATSTPTIPHSCAALTSIEPSIEPSERTTASTASKRQTVFRAKRHPVEVIQNRIASRLGPNGWLILQSVSANHLQTITRLEELGRLPEAELIGLRLRHSQVST